MSTQVNTMTLYIYALPVMSLRKHKVSTSYTLHFPRYSHGNIFPATHLAYRPNAQLPAQKDTMGESNTAQPLKAVGQNAY